jgi:hypothetical protein
MAGCMLKHLALASRGSSLQNTADWIDINIESMNTKYGCIYVICCQYD